MGLKNFIGIQFLENETNAVVPKSWISQENDFIECKWPETSVVSKAKAATKPKSTWTGHPCVILTQAGMFHFISVSTG